jgi:hypothetical protein
MKGVCGGKYQNQLKEPLPKFAAVCLKVRHPFHSSLYHLDFKNSSMVFLLLKSATPACPAGRQVKPDQGDTAWLIIISSLKV